MKQATKIFGGTAYGKFDTQIKFHNHIICAGLADRCSFAASPNILDVFSDLAVDSKVVLTNNGRRDYK